LARRPCLYGLRRHCEARRFVEELLATSRLGEGRELPSAPQGPLPAGRAAKAHQLGTGLHNPLISHILSKLYRGWRGG